MFEYCLKFRLFKQNVLFLCLIAFNYLKKYQDCLNKQSWYHSINVSLLYKLLIFVHYLHHFYLQQLLLNLLNDIIE